MLYKRFLFVFLLSLIFCLNSLKSQEQTLKTYALFPKGKKPKYKKDESVSYVFSKAPQGGDIKLAALGTYDTLNPYALKGTAPVGLTSLESNLLFQSLGITFSDDPYTIYGFIAHEMEYPPSKEWIDFHLRSDAYFHDKTPILADDVVFTFNLLRDKGNPFYKAYYADVKEALKINDYKVRFTIKNPKNHEIFNILAQLPVLPRHDWHHRDFQKDLLTPPLGSGPYKIQKMEPGRYIVYERTSCWCDALPSYKGWWNFKTIRYDYYRDSTLTLQAFLSGDYDIKNEIDPLKWITEYKSPAITQKKIILEELDNKIPSGFLGLFYNLRKPVFQNIKLREALSYFFDFEWLNKSLFYGTHERITSYFNKTEMASKNVPEGEELSLLNQFKKDLPPELFKEPYPIPYHEGTGNIRNQKRKALSILKEGGYSFKEQKLIDPKTNRPLAFTILLQDPHYEKVIQHFVTHLRDIGCEIKIITADSAQYQNKIHHFDYDMIIHNVPPVFVPGNEQKNSWSSELANVTGSKNISGLQNPVVDKLLAFLDNAESWDHLKYITHALDRVLLWNHLAIPLYANAKIRLAKWDRFGQPNESPPYGLPILQTWWIDHHKDNLLKKSRS